MDEIQQLKNEITEIKKRNARVELDKTWETSWARKILSDLFSQLFPCRFLRVLDEAVE